MESSLITGGNQMYHLHWCRKGAIWHLKHWRKDLPLTPAQCWSGAPSMRSLRLVSETAAGSTVYPGGRGKGSWNLALPLPSYPHLACLEMTGLFLVISKLLHSNAFVFSYQM